MLIILEGCDATYKSTVANKLSKKLGLPIVKGSSFEQSQCTADELFLKFVRLIADHDSVIVDRFIYSNLVYATLYDDFAILSPKDKERVESLLWDKGHTVLYLHADNETIKQRLSERGDEYVKEDKIAINDLYEKTMSDANAYLRKYDTTKMNSDEIVEDVVEYYVEDLWG